MNDNLQLQELSGFDVNLKRNLYSENEVYDSVNIGELIDSNSISDVQIKSVSYDKIDDIPDETIDIRGWSSSMVFTQTDADTLSWGAGSINLSDGTVYSISAGNTGNVSSLTFIYLDIDVSETVLQTTTDSSEAVGANKILVAVCQNVAAGLIEYQAFGGKGLGKLITADDIAANTITGNKIAANTIVSNNLTTGELITGSAQIKDGIITNAKISALDAGKITAGYLAAARIEAGAITGTKLADGTVTSVKINSLDADKINVGTLTGFTLQTAASGYRVKLTSAQWLQFMYGDTEKGKIGADTGDSIIYVSLDNHIFKQSNGDEVAKFNEDGLILPAATKVAFASGRSLTDASSEIRCNGDFVPSSDEGNNCGTSTRRWNEVRGRTIWQSASTDGSRHCYDFAYIEKGLIDNKVLKNAEKKQGNMQAANGFITGLKLSFKTGTVLKWTKSGLKENNKETDFAIAIASEKGLPIVLGAEPVRVIGKAKIGDYIVPSNKKGCARACEKPGIYEVIGRCLEDKQDTKESLIKVMIKF